MSDPVRFNELLEVYLSGKATPEEYNALLRLIKSGQYDDLLKQRIDEAFYINHSKETLADERAGELLRNILSAEKHTAKLIPLVRPVNKLRRIYTAAAVAAALLVITLTVWFFLVGSNEEGPALAHTAKKTLQPTADSKGKKYIQLQDGSTVLLNEGSSIEYPDAFATGTREVTLKGEAYFDIKHDAARPFIVHTGAVSTTVLGTAFNIRAYTAQKQVTVTVTRGKVEVKNDQKVLGILTPNERIAINLDTKSFKQEKVNAEEAVEWKKQYLVFDDISLEEAAILIESRYHVTISFSREALRDCRLSATFLNNESLEQVLAVVTGVIDASYTLQPNDQVIISGKGCK